MAKEFSAHTRIDLADPRSVIAAVGAHLVEHGGRVEEGEGLHTLHLANAEARFAHEPRATLVDVAAPTLEELYFMRMMVASHVIEFAPDPAPEIAWSGDGQDLSRPPNFQVLQVVGSRQITPRMRRMTFSGPDIARFDRLNALHVNILVQRPGLPEPQWPVVGANGLVYWNDPDQRPYHRKYTVRSLDSSAGTMDIDFAMHADAGPGCAFADSAVPGDLIGVFGPGGGGLSEADWYLFAGDETALPAIARMLENLPETARGKAFIEVADEGEVQPLETEADIDVKWLFRHGAPAGITSLLPDAVRSAGIRAEDRRYVWAGCEFAAFREIRTHLRADLGLTKEEHLAVAYWRRGAEDEAKAPTGD